MRGNPPASSANADPKSVDPHIKILKKTGADPIYLVPSTCFLCAIVSLCFLFFF